MRRLSQIVGAGLYLFVCGAQAALLSVGPTRAMKVPSEAAAKAHDGDVIEIDTGIYAGDVAVWQRDHLTIRGVGGMAKLKANGHAADDKAIWVIKGRDTTVEYVEFSGARVEDQNGAGIRQEGAGLTVRHCFFHDNENGILGGAGTVTIEYSEFADNGFGDGQSHNLYISERTQRFVLRGSYSHGAKVGHNVKSRARENRILYNRIIDGPDGTPSYSIDLPDGGLAYVIGNIIQQGRDPENSTLLSYGAEGAHKNGPGGLYVVNNTFVNDHHAGIFVRNSNASQPAHVINNIFAGRGKIAVGPADLVSNWKGDDPGFVSRADGDYHLKPGSPAATPGASPGVAEGLALTAAFQYLHPLALEPRPPAGRPDLGAYALVPPGKR